MTFEEFVTARLPAVLRFAGVLTGDRGLAEDVVQDVLIRASSRWQAIAQLDRPEAYVRKMVVNEILSWRRRSWRLVPKLPRRQRAVLVLRYYEGLSDLDIAAVLGCRPGTVRGYASRALAALRIEMAGPARQPLVIKEEG
jgi:DNA-directed RNA polymerase specialized sigma24 family protein